MSLFKHVKISLEFWTSFLRALRASAPWISSVLYLPLKKHILHFFFSRLILHNSLHWQDSRSKSTGRTAFVKLSVAIKANDSTARDAICQLQAMNRNKWNANASVWFQTLIRHVIILRAICWCADVKVLLSLSGF